MLEVPFACLQRLRPLFAGFPGLHGCVDAALEGTMGAVYADDIDSPTIAHIALDFDLLAGDPAAAAAAGAVARLALPASVVTSSQAWELLLRRACGQSLRTRTRVAFQAGAWSRDRLRTLMAALPPTFALQRIEAQDVGRFAALADSLVYNFPSQEEFVARGVGFGIGYEGKFVSGCSSFALSARSLEFEIQTHAGFRRRGLATAVAAAMIEYCLDHGLEPCWDAHNEISAALAEKLGFVAPAPYQSYELLP